MIGTMLCTKFQRITTPCHAYVHRYASGARQLRKTGLRSLSSASPAHVNQAEAGEEGIQSQSGKPRHNVPFAKNLFLGKIEQVQKINGHFRRILTHLDFIIFASEQFSSHLICTF